MGVNASRAAVEQGRQWLLDCALTSGEVEPDDAAERIGAMSADAVVAKVDRLWDGGWAHFKLTVDDEPEVIR